MGQRQAEFRRQRARLMQRPQRLGKRIGAHRQHVARFGDRAMLKIVVPLQAPRAFDAMGPGEIGKGIGQRQRACRDGGCQQQRLYRPGNESEDAGQRQRKIEAPETGGRPKPWQQPFDADDGARLCDPTIDAISRKASRGCGPWR
jgi:hypothetical protein